MILNSAPQAEAILSNVGEIGEFRIRNSAKAFNILSSGLYANKVKAIIRELSCNAIDSHTAAGNTQPFEVHLPTTLEPWFAIRDFGTGLSHDQVTKIYTTYFESTKTESNDFIGALGLGSKSPFSYTDNFTVTAIQNGRKGIYSAFINDVGVPSIALMNEQDTTEPDGVEVKFSVNDRFDFSKFADEAQKVYRWFPVVPTITGNTITITPLQYDTKDIIPGVHSMVVTGGRSASSIAVMGNIAYPIEVPQPEQSLEGLHQLLKCGLVMEFGIGELDFQASREGLSYIPLTIESIRKKLAAVNVALTSVLTKEADAIACYWTRSQFLHEKKNTELWKAAALDYVQKTDFPLYNTDNRWSSSFEIPTLVSELKKMNVQIKRFGAERGSNRCKSYEPHTGYDDDRKAYEYFKIDVSKNVFFVVNDTNKGSFERTKHHFRQMDKSKFYTHDVFVLDKIDKEKDMDLVAFYAMIHNPPTDQRMVVSSLIEKPRAASSGNGLGKNVTLLKLEKRGGPSNRSSSLDYVWRDAGKLSDYNNQQKFYYVPLSAFKVHFNKLRYTSVNDLNHMLKRTELDEFNVAVYGVRKGDIEEIKKMSNWINLEEHIFDTLNSLNTKICMATVMERLDKHNIFSYNYQTIVDKVDAKSPVKSFLDGFVGLPKLRGIHWLRNLMRHCGVENTLIVDDLFLQYETKLKEFSKRYPLLEKLGSYANEDDVCEYVNLIDTVKGV